MTSSETYRLAAEKADQLEAELKRLGRWDEVPLPEQQFVNMGAFGSNSMRFEQWLQFILIPTIREIIQEEGQFPEESMLGAYAVRAFDGDMDAYALQELLSQLDDLIEGIAPDEAELPEALAASNDTVSLGGTDIPPVLITLADLLPQFEGADLESQLQTFDTFLAILSPVVRPEIARMLQGAAGKSSNDMGRLRIEQAADSILKGGRASEPYDHQAAIRKYQEEHRKSFPS